MHPPKLGSRKTKGSVVSALNEKEIMNDAEKNLKYFNTFFTSIFTRRSTLR